MLPSPIYAITDPGLLPGERLFTAVETALTAGIRLVQLRHKQADIEQLRPMVQRLVGLCRQHGAACILNDHVTLVLETGAHGVHLGQSDGSVRDARRLLGEDAIIGVTCHGDLALARRAQDEGASYVAFGRFYSSNTKPLAKAADPEVLRAARREIALPVVAIGGIDRDNMAPLLEAGAQTLAVCHSLFGTEDIALAARALLAEYDRVTGGFPEQPNLRLDTL
jgi:thiamine-phosphate pyrophosphorylase